MARHRPSMHALGMWFPVFVKCWESSNLNHRLRYCFGAPYVCDELAKNTVNAGAFAHPAFLKDAHFSKITSLLSLFNLLNSKQKLIILNRATITVLFCGRPYISSTSQTSRFRYPGVKSKDLPIPTFLWCIARICSTG